jgi:hypothetical protein
MVDVRKKHGKEFLHIKILGKMIGFFEEKDIGVEVKEGDIISCRILRKGKFFNGSELKVVCKEEDEQEGMDIDFQLNIEHENKNPDSKLHAGPRIYHFEIKTSSRGDKYLVITEQSGSKKNRIFIFDDHAKEFSEKVSEFLNKIM